ncbi:major facilitator superfamily MFS_1 (plasmid) [Gemmatirosa kalamazoonensis]|uniref:Major facilitator superfamily MFS_1 n=2 Tax=Gemmatirosa kalamazoonensis TaxID=861299 RepID=W0RTQ0_9BACT|nr:major facilitator superfamily MFS_1 [Gemmatirosa kalamazoonensis]
MTDADRPTRPALPARRARGAWLALALLTLANVSGFVDRQVLSLLVEPIRHDLSLTDTQVSLLMGLGFVVVSSTLALPMGRVADTRSRRGLLAAGAAAWSLATTLTGLARGYGQLLVARMAVGAGEAALQPGAISLLADLFPPAQLGRAMSVYTLGTFLGSGIAYVLGAWGIAFAAEHLATWPVLGAVRPWQSVYLLVGLVSFVVAPLLLLVREPPRRETARVPVRAVAAYVRAHADAVVPLSLGFACSAAVNYGIAGWLATFFVRTHGWSAARAGVLQGSLTMTVGVLGALGGGWLSDRLVRRGRVDGPLLVGVVGALGMLVCAGAYPLLASATAAAVLLVPVNVFAALPWGPANAAMAELMPERMRGQGAALMLLVVNLVSGALGPTAVALATDRLFGGAAGLRYALSTVSVVGMLLAAGLLLAARGPFRRTVRGA